MNKFHTLHRFVKKNSISVVDLFLKPNHKFYWANKWNSKYLLDILSNKTKFLITDVVALFIQKRPHGNCLQAWEVCRRMLCSAPPHKNNNNNNRHKRGKVFVKEMHEKIWNYRARKKEKIAIWCLGVKKFFII